MIAGVEDLLLEPSCHTLLCPARWTFPLPLLKLLLMWRIRIRTQI